jgi:hypothetical protein
MNTVDGALLRESPEAALLEALSSLPDLQSLWAIHPRLYLQKWCYQRGVPWFIVGEGFRDELWRWPLTKNLPNVLVVRFQPEFPFSMAKTQLKLGPLFHLSQLGQIPTVLDRHALPAFLSAPLNQWLRSLSERFPLLELHSVATGRGNVLGAVTGSRDWLTALEQQTPYAKLCL